MIGKIEQWCMYVGAIILIATPFVGSAQRWARVWLADALKTKSTHDDKVARLLVRAIDGVAWIITLLPRVTTGIGEVKRVRDAVRRIPRPTALLTLVLAMCLASTACGATQLDRARTILSVSGQGVVAAEQVFETHYAAAGERAREESDTYEQYVDAMRNWNLAATGIRLTAASMHLAEAQLDAIEQGMEGDVGGVLACVGSSLVELLDVLTVVIDVPDELEIAIRLVGTIAGDRCVPITRPTEPSEEARVLIPAGAL